MTIDDLVAECWAELPPIRKRLAGRDAVRRIVTDAVQEWSADYLGSCQDDAHRQAYADALTKRLEQRYAGQPEYSFVLMSIILAAVISAVVQWLVKWWLDNHFNREQMQAWQREMAA